MTGHFVIKLCKPSCAGFTLINLTQKSFSKDKLLEKAKGDLLTDRPLYIENEIFLKDYIT